MFSHYCVACDRRCDDWFCPGCVLSLYENTVMCPRCAEPLEVAEPMLCRRCRKRGTPLTTAYAPYRYGGELATVISKLKNARCVWNARALGRMISKDLEQKSAQTDLLLSIPSTRAQICKRGFDPCQLILRFTDVPVAKKLWLKRRSGPSQKGLLAQARVQNVRGKFFVPKRYRTKVSGKRVLLFDDVMTTGATVREAARTLRRAGVLEVHVFAVARAET